MYSLVWGLMVCFLVAFSFFLLSPNTSSHIRTFPPSLSRMGTPTSVPTFLKVTPSLPKPKCHLLRETSVATLSEAASPSSLFLRCFLHIGNTLSLRLPVFCLPPATSMETPPE